MLIIRVNIPGNTATYVIEGLPDREIDCIQCGYGPCLEPVMSPAKFCSDKHRVMYWKKVKGPISSYAPR